MTAATKSERGTLSMVMITGVLMLALMALGAADLGSMLIARGRAQAAADAAALATAIALVPALGSGADPASVARDYAERNGATLVRCTCTSGTANAEVEVEVRPTLAYVSAWFGRHVHATARAELDPAVLSYR